MNSLPLTINQPANLQSRQFGYAALPIWVAYLFVCSVFSKEIGHATIGGFDYDLIGYNFAIFYFVYMFRDFYFNRNMLFYYSFLLVTGFIAKVYLNYSFGPFLKQFVPIVIIYSVSYDVFRRFNFMLLFKIYFQVAFYTAIFGFIQLAVKITTGIYLLTKYSGYFIDSVAYEPSHYTVLMMPAAVYALMHFKEHKWRSAIVVGAVVCTFSSTAILCLMISVAFLYQGFFYLLLIAPVLYFVFTSILLNIESFRFRFEGFQKYFEYGNFKYVKSATSISFLSNAEVAINSVKVSPLFGTGLGGHETQYEEFFKNKSFKYHYLYGLNKMSAHNLLIRVFGETGLVGFFLFIRALVIGTVLNPSVPHRVISIACLSHFFARSIKLGGYFDYGTPFFVMMMFFNYYDYKLNYKNK